MSKKNKNIALLLVAGLLFITGYFSDLFFNPELTVNDSRVQGVESTTSDLVEVIRIVDGDTIEIEGGQKVRYIGIDTPESTNKKECFGREASLKNEELVLGKRVRLEKDVSETDRYGRLLRYVYVDSPGGAEEVFVNNEMVLSGYAMVSTYPPDIKYKDLFMVSERYAREESVGLWSECSLL